MAANRLESVDEAGSRPRRLWPWLIMVLVLAGIVLPRLNDLGKHPRLSLESFRARFAAGEIASAEVGKSRIICECRAPVVTDGPAGKVFQVDLPDELGGSPDFQQWLRDNRHETALKFDRGVFASVVLPILPFAAIFLAIWIFIMRPLQRRARNRDAAAGTG